MLFLLVWKHDEICIRMKKFILRSSLHLFVLTEYCGVERKGFR
ncbi:hypothetical protein MNV_120035 [Candidatus Methanoperedens nitroreducens]|uniref:Uncharacterized protein n=1 Tax=Candidatus Methanoperedens nitratireducens TaxID=1392998 RepID=A0A284VJN9_9EURY|nr:hypothetical protein MNV_120035 [Candidatus Methanoperedens nitroreducens]